MKTELKRIEQKMNINETLSKIRNKPENWISFTICIMVGKKCKSGFDTGAKTRLK